MGCWHVAHGQIDRTNLILCSILLFIDSIEHFGSRVGGRIESMCSMRLDPRHEPLHSTKMRPCFCYEWPERCMLSISSVGRIERDLLHIPRVS